MDWNQIQGSWGKYLVAAKSQWDKLSADQQKILQDAGTNLAKNSIEGVFINPPPTATNFVISPR